MKYRIEKDTLGNVKVAEGKYWGAQTQRSIENFKIGPIGSMPKEIIYAYAIVKMSAAVSNNELKILDSNKKNLIVKVCKEILEGQHDSQFPLVIWQTGSGTQTNMNINEVISNRAHEISGGKLDDDVKIIHPNDDVNKSQSSNDTFPTSMNIACYKIINEHTLPALKDLKNTIEKKSKRYKDVIKIGRTHLMDATPISLGQEFSAFGAQIENGIKSLESSMKRFLEIPIGGTAVGTGLNTPKNYDKIMCKNISNFIGIEFLPSKNKFESISSKDAFVDVHSCLKLIAVSLNKIANDIRFLASGPRAGISEIKLPMNEPGSSIMPGKVNPTQCESLSMVCSQIIGNDSTINVSAMQSHFQLNTFMPVIASNFIQSATLLSDSVNSFNLNCFSGIEPNFEKIENNLKNSLMLVTALNTKIGYDNAAKIAKKAFANGTTLKEEALKTGLLDESEYEKLVNPKLMC